MKSNPFKSIVFTLLLSAGCFLPSASMARGDTPVQSQIDTLSAPRYYKSVNLIYHNADSLHFGATLTLPLGVKRPPVCIIVSGTGPQDRDGTMAGHKMFLQIADYLSRRGIAVLRSDDRGVGQSNGVYDKATTADFASDVLAAVSYLKTRNDINTKKIGLLGHSEGGAVISIAASKSKDIKFLISMAGLATDGLTALLRQNASLVAASPLSTDDKRRSNEIDSLMFTTARRYADADSLTLAGHLNAVYSAWKKLDDARFKAAHPGEYDRFRFSVWMYVRQATGPWYRFFISYDPSRYLSKVEVPVLALNGEKDLMSDYRLNLPNFKRYLVHDKDVTTIALPGLNHLFLPCKTGLPQEYSSIKAPVSPEALDIIYKWLKKRI